VRNTSTACTGCGNIALLAGLPTVVDNLQLIDFNIHLFNPADTEKADMGMGDPGAHSAAHLSVVSTSVTSQVYRASPGAHRKRPTPAGPRGRQ